MSLFRRNKPAQLRWGSEPNQLADVYFPIGEPLGVVALVHGGFWQAMYGREGLAAHCSVLAADGYIAANLAYRRVGDPSGGFPNTCTDVLGALQALSDAHGQLTAVVGHSAGGHLALWASREVDPKPRVVVSIAGSNDLVLLHETEIGRKPVESLLGGDMALLPKADPAQRVPLGTRTVLVSPSDDFPGSLALAESYLAKARAAGDDVVIESVPGDHFAVLDVGSYVWDAVERAIAAATPR